MRILSCLLIVLGIYLLALACRDQVRGSTTRPVFMGRGQVSSGNSAYLNAWPVLSQYNPKLFHQFMAAHWIYAVLIGVSGWVLLALSRKSGGDGN